MNSNPTTWRVKGVLIDFDGTLVDTIPVLKEVYQTFLAKRNKQGSNREFQSLNGASISEIVSTLKKNHQLSIDLKEGELLYHQLIEQAYSKAALFKNAKRTLMHLKVWGFTVAIVSSAPKHLIESILTHHQLFPLIDLIVSGPKFKEGKYHPEVYYQTLEALKLSPHETIAIEDSENGLRAALSAGIPSIWLFPPKTHDHIDAPICQSWQEIESLANNWWQNQRGQLVPVSQKLRIIVEKEPEIRKVPPNILSQIDKIWDKEQVKRKGKLFNGEVFSVTSWNKSTIKGEFVEYKWVMAQFCDPSIAELLKLKPLAINGRTVAGEAVLLGKRADWVTQAPGQIEFSPSGSIDSESFVDNKIDFTLQVQKELWEETGLDPSMIREILPIALQEDREASTLELYVDIVLDPAAVSYTLKPNTEYVWLKWMY